MMLADHLRALDLLIMPRILFYFVCIMVLLYVESSESSRILKNLQQNLRNVSVTALFWFWVFIVGETVMLARTAADKRVVG